MSLINKLISDFRKFFLSYKISSLFQKKNNIFLTFIKVDERSTMNNVYKT